MPGSDGDSPGGSEGGRRRRLTNPDEWNWRHRVRANPRTRGPYRAMVGFLGGFFVLLAALTGWLPGPGGIPLALIGLAILASEFDWAQRILDRCKDAYDRFVDWTQSLHPFWRWLGGVATVSLVLGAVWGFLAVKGVPSFTPAAMVGYLDALPWVER